MRSMTRSTLTMAVACALTGLSAQAQEAEDDTTVEIETIKVTAKRREQVDQEIGMSLVALTGEELVERRIESPLDLQATVPNVNIKQITPGLFPVFTIRGVGLNDFSAGNNPTVGVYLDDVFLTSTTQLTFQLFDVSRVEVLKGPQGTLYGRNTTGGAINFITAKPEFDNSAQFNLGVGNFDMSEFGFALNRELSDTVAVRFSGKGFNQGEGFFTSRTLDGEDIGSREEYAGRFQLTWLASDTAEINFKLEGATANSEVGQFEHFGTLEAGVFPPAPCAAILAGRIDPATCADAFGYADNDGDPFTGDWNNDAPHTYDSLAATLTADIDIGEGTLTSVTGWIDFERAAFNDTDSGPFVQAEFDAMDEVEQFTQEIRYAFSPTDDVDLIAGVYFSYDKVTTNVPGDLSQLFMTQVLIASEQTTRAQAAFVDWEWQFSDATALVGGLRLTHEEKDFRGGMSDENPFGTSCLLSPVCSPGFAGSVQVAFNDETISITEPSWRIGLNHDIKEDVMVYGSVARGFKSGGFFSGGFVTSNAQLAPFAEETLTAYEVGVKSFLANNSVRFNAAAFYYDYSDVQTFTQVSEGGLTVIRLSNIDDAEIRGVEADVLWRATRNLEIQLSAGYLDTELGAFSAQGRGPLPAGNVLPNAPELTLNGRIRYEWQVGEGLMYAEGVYSYTDDTFKEAVNVPFLAADDFYTVDARLAYRSADDDWEVALWGRNVTDEVYLFHAFDNGIGNGGRTVGAPRTFGLSFRYLGL